MIVGKSGPKGKLLFTLRDMRGIIVLPIGELEIKNYA